MAFPHQDLAIVDLPVIAALNETEGYHHVFGGCDNRANFRSVDSPWKHIEIGGGKVVRERQFRSILEAVSTLENALSIDELLDLLMPSIAGHLASSNPPKEMVL
jgi:hypothetical protein